MSALAKDMVDTYGPLTAVLQVEQTDAAAALVLRFERGAVVVTANGDDDTIAMQPHADGLGVDLSREQPWCSAINRGLLWVWSLTNQQGFEDGYQLEFGTAAHGDQPEHLSIQLMVAGSAIQIATVSAWQR